MRGLHKGELGRPEVFIELRNKDNVFPVVCPHWQAGKAEFQWVNLRCPLDKLHSKQIKSYFSC